MIKPELAWGFNPLITLIFFVLGNQCYIDCVLKLFFKINTKRFKAIRNNLMAWMMM